MVIQVFFFKLNYIFCVTAPGMVIFAMFPFINGRKFIQTVTFVPITSEEVQSKHELITYTFKLV